MRHMAFVVGIAALVLATPSSALERSTVDRPDEIPGAQVHVVYAVPSDAPDRGLDVDGGIEASLEVLQRWVGEQMDGRRFRIDTYAGRPDITFIRLGFPASLAAARSDVNLLVKDELRRARVYDPSKMYAIYYDGPASSCGSGELGGTAVGMYLHAQGCNYDWDAARNGRVGFLEYVMVHELLHGLGAVPRCAPHFQPGDHTTDDQRDLMFQGVPPYWLPTPLIDPGRDDYYGHGRSDCLDVARSLFLAPPGTARVVVRLDGTRQGSVRSANGELDCPDRCEADVPLGTQLQLTATTPTRAVFTGWSRPCATAPRCAVDVRGDVAVTARFAPARHRITVTVRGPGRVIARARSCTRKCVVTMQDAQVLTLRPIAARGARFIGWSGACRGRANCTLTVIRSAAVAARFAHRA